VVVLCGLKGKVLLRRVKLFPPRTRVRSWKMSEKIIDGALPSSLALLLPTFLPLLFSCTPSSFLLSAYSSPPPPSSTHLPAGNAIAAEIRIQLAQQINEMEQKPGLAVILVGARTDSATYVRMKRKACLEVGIHNFSVDYDESVSQEELLQKIDQLNQNPEVHGILVQLPLPRHINEDVILQRVSVEKDVDGLHPLNMASLSRTQTHASSSGSGSVSGGFSFSDLDYNVACTPQGCIELLDRIGYPIQSKRAVVLGRSNIVGIPVALLLMQRNATVTIVHSKSTDVPALVREADIVIAAVGRPELVQGDWIKPGAIVIDVGVNSVPDSTKKKGYALEEYNEQRYENTTKDGRSWGDAPTASGS
jgi:5,10-methylene-tetrahydrofolate dehydrogenase/methenyl tetrahydrofolate cyclohydrolase